MSSDDVDDTMIYDFELIVLRMHSFSFGSFDKDAEESEDETITEGESTQNIGDSVKSELSDP